VENSVLEARITALERENRILRQKLARSETNRALIEEVLTSHLEVVKAYAQVAEDRDAYRALSTKLRAEIEKEYSEKAKVNEKLYKNGGVDGADSWWLDATEPDIVSNMDIADRKEQMNPTAKGTSARVYNAFSINHCRWFYEGQRAANENKRVVILTRSSYPGHQRYGAATWSGDVASRWEDLKKQITCGLNFCAAGIPYWTTDIGGFAVEPRYEKAIGRDERVQGTEHALVSVRRVQPPLPRPRSVPVPRSVPPVPGGSPGVQGDGGLQPSPLPPDAVH